MVGGFAELSLEVGFPIENLIIGCGTFKFIFSRFCWFPFAADSDIIMLHRVSMCFLPGLSLASKSIDLNVSII